VLPFRSCRVSGNGCFSRSVRDRWSLASGAPIAAKSSLWQRYGLSGMVGQRVCSCNDLRWRRAKPDHPGGRL